MGLVIVMGALLRVPFLFQPSLGLDGDEAILGLMALQWKDAGEVAGFFWGQCYGWSTLEAGAAALTYSLAGTSAATTQGAMLALFVLGTAAWGAALRRILGEWPGLAACCVLSAVPAWIPFSMKSWGGLVSAYLLSGCALLALSPRKESSRIPDWAFLGSAGVLFALAFVAHPLTGGTLGLLLLSREIRPRGPLRLAFLGVPALFTFLWLRFGMGCTETYWQPSLWGKFDFYSSLRQAGSAIATMASGVHFMRDSMQPLQSGSLSAVVLLLVGGFAAVRSFLRWARTQFLPLDSAASLAILALFAVVASMQAESIMPRYFLPIVAPAAIVIGALARTRGRAAIVGLASFVLGASFAAQHHRTSFCGWSRQQVRAIREVCADLESNGVQHAFVTHPTLPWTIMFESGGRVIARWIEPHDRRPDLVSQVNEALQRGAPTALVVPRGDSFAWVPNPTRAQLEGLGFRFTESP